MTYKASDWVSVTIDDVTWQHKKPEPWKVETFKSGLCCVTNAMGANWLTDGTGQVLCTRETAEQIAAALNASTQK